MAPEVIEWIQFGTGFWQPAQFDPQLARQAATGRCPLGRNSVEKENDLPAAPTTTNKVGPGCQFVRPGAHHQKRVNLNFSHTSQRPGLQYVVTHCIDWILLSIVWS